MSFSLPKPLYPLLILLACNLMVSSAFANDAQTPHQQLAKLSLPESPTDSAIDLSANKKPVYIAIIIDDLGYNLKQGIKAARYPGALTLAILPHSPNGIALAELAYQNGKEIMLHAPMSTIQQRPLDPGGLTEQMDQQLFINTLREGISSIPHARGINNHMGSQLTRLQQPMEWLMEELKQQQLFFIDSRTSPESQAWQIAQSHQVPSNRRDVFLDNERNAAAIATQFERLIDIAKQRGYAIGIGHPYPETMAFLEQQAEKLPEWGVELVNISHLLSQP